MKVTLVVVPPGGGKQDYQLVFDLPAVPEKGTFIAVARDDKKNTPEYRYEFFFVRRARWDLDYPHSRTTGAGSDIGSVSKIYVEVEVARGSWMSPDHKRSCDGYEARGLPVRDFDAE